MNSKVNRLSVGKCKKLVKLLQACTYCSEFLEKENYVSLFNLQIKSKTVKDFVPSYAARISFNLVRPSIPCSGVVANLTPLMIFY